MTLWSIITEARIERLEGEFVVSVWIAANPSITRFWGWGRVGHNPTQMYARRIKMLSAHYLGLFDVLPQQVDSDLFLSRCAMSRTFNAVGRVISNLIGVLMVLMGGSWILQG